MSYFIALRKASDRASSRARQRPRKVPKCRSAFSTSHRIELRTHIYSFAVMDTQHAIKFKPHSRSLPLYLRRTDPDWNHQTRRILGLIRVCKEIRKEFLPLHLADHTVQLNGPDLERYMALVLVRIDGPLSQAVGKFVINTVDEEDGWVPRAELSAGLLTLLELCTIAPMFKANILRCDDDGGTHPQLVPLTWTPTWQKWADIRLVDLIYLDWMKDKIRATVDVMVKLAHRVQRETVDYDEERLICDLEQDVERWMEKVGWGEGKSTVEVEVIFAVC